jgi:hypothetical protein
MVAVGLVQQVSVGIFNNIYLSVLLVENQNHKGVF